MPDVELQLVEDNNCDAEMSIKALKPYGLSKNMLHVYDGAAPLDFLLAEGIFIGRNTRKKSKVILLDLKMPKLNEMEVLQTMRASLRTKSIPVVILTSSKEDADIKICYNLGVNSCVVNPVEFNEFQKAMADPGLYCMIVNQQLK